MTRKVLIYGGSGGIGSAAGQVLRAQGYDLHLVGRNADKLAATAAELEATFTVGDVTDGSLFSRVAQDAGESLDGLLYAVGTINLRSLGRVTEADFLTDFRVNALGAALAVQGSAGAEEKRGQAFGGFVFERGGPAGIHISRVDRYGEGGR